MSEDLLTAQSFEPHIGSGFVLHTEEHDEILTLTSVDPGKPSYTGARESFALVFKGSSADLMLHSQTVYFKHEVMGDVSMMISPFGRTDDGFFRYEAVFN